MNLPLGPFPISERLRFRLPSGNDAGFYHRLMNEPDYIRFIADHGIRTEDDARNYINNKSLARFATHGVGLWVIEPKQAPEPIGVCGLVVRNELKYPDLGFAFLEEHRGNGYGREAGQAVLEFVQKELKLSTLCAITNPENQRSANLLVKLGFEADGQRHLSEIGSTSNYYEWKPRRADRGPA